MAQRSTSRRGGSSSTRSRPGNQTPNTPAASESEISQLKVDELRKRLKEQGVSGVSSLRKPELVKALVKTMRSDKASGSGTKQSAGAKKAVPSREPDATAKQSGPGGGLRTGPRTSRSLKYAQEISSPADEPERPGRSLATTDHDVIRQWAEARNAVPATVEDTEHGDRLGVLQFRFPRSRRAQLREVTWDEWFATFDERQLNFIYQQESSDRRQSNFFRLESPQREDA
jgi:hypothetical protein